MLGGVARQTQLAPLIKKLRKREGMTQAQLAEAIGQSTGMITQVEIGERNPSADTLLKIADALEATDAERRQLELARRADRAGALLLEELLRRQDGDET